MTRRLPAGIFYGVIVAGVLLGIASSAAAGWAYITFGESKPSGRRIWDGIANEFVLPVCVMVGATFGGLLGVAVAALADRRFRKPTSR